MVVDVGARDLLVRASEHLDAKEHLKDGSATASLLLFYAAECKLKAAIMRRGNLRSTEQLPAEIRSHDMRSMLKCLNAPSSVTALPSCRVRHTKDGNVPPLMFSELHQAWRYGKPLDKKEEVGALAALAAVICWSTAEIGGGGYS